jgi:hypothetical protein
MKQSDADDIRKWEKELTRDFERFSVCIVSTSVQSLPHKPDRPMPCYISTPVQPTYKLATRLRNSGSPEHMSMVGLHICLTVREEPHLL